MAISHAGLAVFCRVFVTSISLHTASRHFEAVVGPSRREGGLIGTSPSFFLPLQRQLLDSFAIQLTMELDTHRDLQGVNTEKGVCSLAWWSRSSLCVRRRKTFLAGLVAPCIISSMEPAAPC